LNRVIVAPGMGHEFDVVVQDAKDGVFHGDSDRLSGVGSSDSQLLSRHGDGADVGNASHRALRRRRRR
jgi:hypothetical protein